MLVIQDKLLLLFLQVIALKINPKKLANANNKIADAETVMALAAPFYVHTGH